MSKSLKALGLAIGALALTHLPAAAQTKVTNDGISATEIVIGTHQDLSGPIKVWGVPVSNGMKMAVEEINAAGGIQGRKLRMILEDNGYDPKRVSGFAFGMGIDRLALLKYGVDDIQLFFQGDVRFLQQFG